MADDFDIPSVVKNGECLPSLYIVGGPKCGTTALYDYLQSHPSIFFPREKEPHYFATDFPEYRRIRTWDRYQALYAEAPDVPIVGDASVFYLFSEDAVRHIEQLSGQAKYIVMVRNPIEMVASLHTQYLYSLKEELPIEEAWSLQGKRARGEQLPSHCPAPRHLQYADVCSLGAQLQTLLGLVPEDRVEVIVFDDFKADTKGVYQRVLEFLNVPDDGRSEFERVNGAHAHRFLGLGRFLMTPPFPLNVVKRWIKDRFKLENTKVANAIYDLNSKPTSRTVMTPDFRSELARVFAEDVSLLGSLLGRDLSHWLVESEEIGVPASLTRSDVIAGTLR